MRALTLTEPFATLMMLREKKIETRSWKLPDKYIGEEVIIHSAKGYPKWAQALCEQEPFRSSLRYPDGNYAYPEFNRTEGLCRVKFIGCRRTEDIRSQLTEKELAFGNYFDGRWAWLTEYCQIIDRREPHVGHLGFWEW